MQAANRHRMNILEFRRFLSERRVRTMHYDSSEQPQERPCCGGAKLCADFTQWLFCVNPNVMRLTGGGIDMTIRPVKAFLVEEESDRQYLIDILYDSYPDRSVKSYRITAMAN